LPSENAASRVDTNLHSQALEAVDRWAQKYRDEAVIYLSSGALLGLYRDGRLIPGDSDIDFRYGIVVGNDKAAVAREELNELNKKYPILSFNDLYEWGDYVHGLHRQDINKAVLMELSSRLCLVPTDRSRFKVPLPTLQEVPSD